MSGETRVSTPQIQKAVNALLSFSQKKKKVAQEDGKTLFADDEENFWLVVTTKTMPGGKLSLKPQRMSVFTDLLSLHTDSTSPHGFPVPKPLILLLFNSIYAFKSQSKVHCRIHRLTRARHRFALSRRILNAHTKIFSLKMI